nr:MAG TPA: hypothetical protein [Caudoviricetes sp.]
MIRFQGRVAPGLSGFGLSSAYEFERCRRR